ncbi:hypothetical protein SUGI_0071720 [Cryptomeria japonica]|nr:hypothetical protein SUGI_0071720 [Cryptomeria japonica]
MEKPNAKKVTPLSEDLSLQGSPQLHRLLMMNLDPEKSVTGTTKSSSMFSKGELGELTTKFELNSGKSLSFRVRKEIFVSRALELTNI